MNNPLKVEINPGGKLQLDEMFEMTKFGIQTVALQRYETATTIISYTCPE